MAYISENSIAAGMSKAPVSGWNPALTEQFIAHAASAGQRDKNLGERMVILSVVFDALVIAGAMLASFWLRFYTFIADYGIESEVRLRDYAGYVTVGAASMLFTLAYRGFYSKGVILRYRKVTRQSFESLLIWVLGFLSVSLIFKFYPPVSRLYVAIAGVNLLAGLLTVRWVFDWLLHRSDAVASLRQRVLFVGWNEEAERLANAFGTDQADAYEFVGCVAPARREFLREPPDRRLILGNEEQIADILERCGIDIVMLADMNSPQGEIVGLANLCEKMMVQFKVVPSYFQILVSGLHLETVSGIPILGVSRLPLDRTANIVLKRAVDIVGAIVGLLLTIPLMAIFGAIVYVESPGPVLYRQRRLGRHGREFHIFKIRSMKLDAEVDGRVGWTTRHDPRRLRIGEFMRHWNIDEVPQFWNVLKGDMSLVGPRPERPELIRNFKEEIPHYNARHNVKPGITGWAQVKGFRGDTDLGERIKCDLFYLENWNLLLDFQIMVMTFFRRENAC